jgi:AcrR family transcriptional regulator
MTLYLNPISTSASVTEAMVACNLPLTERGRRTRAALLNAAVVVFERDGYLDARIADIASEAGVAHGTFYTYFDSKQAVFKEVVEELVDELYAASHVGDVAGPDPLAQIAAANRLYLEAFARHARLHELLIQVSTFDEFFKQQRQAARQAFIARAVRGLRRLQDQGRADGSLDTESVAAVLCGMVENFTQVRHLLGEPFDDERAVDALTLVWTRAIGLSR